ncbi:MAG: polysaccharide deacetylase family protein [Chloroflexota bacterium]
MSAGRGSGDARRRGTRGRPATAFLQGRWAMAQPGVARALATAGWLVGNHSHHHAPFPELTRPVAVRT